MNTFRPFDKTLCTFCGGDSFIVGMLPTQISLECVSCHIFQYPLVPQQEPAVQVPATAPAAGHLSATSPITLSDDAQHQVIPNCPSCGAQYADLVHDPVLKIDFIMCSDRHFEGEASQHLSTETVDK